MHRNLETFTGYWSRKRESSLLQDMSNLSKLDWNSVIWGTRLNHYTFMMMMIKRRKTCKLLLFLCWKNLIVSSSLRDSGTIQWMQRCIVSTLLAVILTLVYTQVKKKVSFWSSLFMLMILSLHLTHQIFFKSQSCSERKLQNRWSRWSVLVPWDTGCIMSTQCTPNSKDLHSQDAWEIWHARLQTLQNFCNCSGEERLSFSERKFIWGG